MIDSKEELLLAYINYQKAEGLTSAQIATKIGLHASVVSRLSGGKTKLNAKIMGKVAIALVGRKNATIEEGCALMQSEITGVASRSSAFTVRVGTGFTTWSAYILAMIYDQHHTFVHQALKTIEFVFCNRMNDEDGKQHPYFVQTRNDIQEIRIHPTRFRHKYIANDLHNLLEEKQIDGAILLRPTFDAMKWKHIEQPVLLSRILVGNGTNLYVIGNRAIMDQELNSIVEVGNAAEITDAKDAFCKFVKGKKVRTLMLGNQTIQDDMAKFLEDDKVMKSLDYPAPDVINNIDGDDYENCLDRIKAAFQAGQDGSKPIDVLLVIAFAPLNHIIFQHLTGNGLQLVYRSYNLSKMVEEKASYGLYVRVDVLKDVKRLKKLVDFLDALEIYVKNSSGVLIMHICQNLAGLYYADNRTDDNAASGSGDINKMTLMKSDLRYLEYNNQSLQLLRQLIPMLAR
jgi:hypothetical protein